MKLLSTMAAIRLEEDGDNIENTLSLALLDTSRPGTTDRSIQSSDPLASSSWEKVRKLCFACQIWVYLVKCFDEDAIHEQVPEEKTLITPVQCKNLWRQFKAETEYTVTQAIAAQVSPPVDPFHLLPYMCCQNFCRCHLKVLYFDNYFWKFWEVGLFT